MFKQTKIRLIAASSLLVLLLAGGAFLMIKHGFKADTVNNLTNAASVSYNDSTGTVVSVDSNAITLDITNPVDPKVAVKTQMDHVLSVAQDCRTSGGSVFVTPEDYDTPANAARITAMNNGTQPVCNTTNIADPTAKARLNAEKYPSLAGGANGYSYYYPAVDADRNTGANAIFVSVDGGTDGDNLSCTYTICKWASTN